MTLHTQDACSKCHRMHSKYALCPIFKCEACGEGGIPVESTKKHYDYDCPVMRTKYVHRHDPVFRWYRAVCDYEPLTFDTEPITHDENKITCPKCLKWMAERKTK